MARTASNRNSNPVTPKEDRYSGVNILESQVVFVLKGNRTPPYERLPSEIISLNPSTKKKEMARYVAGIPTIWKGEQPREVSKSQVIMENGRLLVEQGDTTLFEYLTTIPLFNELYEIENLDIIAKDKNANARLNRRALSLLDDKLMDDSGLKELETVCRFLGLWSPNMSRDMIESSLTDFIVGTENLRANPQMFIDSFDNEVVSTKALVERAREMGMIDFSVPNRARYHGEGIDICVIGSGEDPVDALVNFALSSKGVGVVQKIRYLVGED